MKRAIWFASMVLAGLIALHCSEAHANPAPLTKDIHITAPGGHLFITLHPDGSYTCNEKRTAKEIGAPEENESSQWLAIYFALCGHRR